MAQPSTWTPVQPPASPAWAPPPGPSGMLKASTILLLVGAILSAVGAFFLLALGAVLVAIGGDETRIPAFVGAIYLVGGLLTAAGCAVGFSAWSRAKAGDTRSAFVRGLVSSLLPPLQVVTLIGAILAKVSPEGEAAERGANPHR